MPNRRRHRTVEEDLHGSGLAPFASVSDLLVALLLFFVATTAISLADLRRARELISGKAPSAPERPLVVDSPEQQWGLSFQQFEQGQTTLRVQEIWKSAFASFPASLRPPSSVEIRLPNIARMRRAIAKDPDVVEGAKSALRVALGTDWDRQESSTGCMFEVRPSVSLVFTRPAKESSPGFDSAHEILEQFTSQRYRAKLGRVDYVSSRRLNDRASLSITFSLSEGLRKRLQSRFQRGPGKLQAGRMWCE